MTRKPLSKWAISMWLFAALYLAGAVAWTLAASRYGALESRYLLNQIVLANLFGNIVRPALFSTPMLVGIGILIEKADQIRWAALSEDERIAIKSRRGFIERLRKWPD